MSKRPPGYRATQLRGLAAQALGLAAAALVAHPASAFTATLTAVAPKTIYLQVGAGTFTGGNYTPIRNNGLPTGTPGTNTTINNVTASIAAASVGNGTAQAMTSNSTVVSLWDGFTFCNTGELYIGGFYRTTGNGTGTVVGATWYRSP